DRPDEAGRGRRSRPRRLLVPPRPDRTGAPDDHRCFCRPTRPPRLGGTRGRRVDPGSSSQDRRLLARDEAAPGLAAALLGRPRNIVLDEPMNGLDPQGMEWMRAFLRDAAASGHAVLVSSHLLGEMETLADRLVVIDNGRLLGQWDVADL